MPSIDPSISQNPQLFGTQHTAAPQKTTATQTLTQRQSPFEDATESLADLSRIGKDYKQGAGQPELKPPKPGSENTELNVVAEIMREIHEDTVTLTGNEMSQMAEENEELVEESTKKTSKKHEEGAKKPKGDRGQVNQHNGSKPHSPLDDHVRGRINNEIDNLFMSGEIGKYSSTFGGMTDDEIREELMHAYSHPQSVSLESPIHGLMSVIKKNVKDAMDVSQSFKSQKAELDHEARVAYSNNFAIILEGFDAPLEDKQAVLYAFNNNHGTKEKLSSSQKALFHDVSTEAMAEVDQLYGVRRAPKVDGNYYNAQINNHFVQSYEAALKSNLKEGTITQDQYLAMRTRLYYPDSIEVDDTIVGLETSLRADVLSRTIEANGLPPDWQPTVSTILFDAIANGTWRDAFDDAVNADTTLDAATKAQLIQGRANPDALTAALRSKFDNFNMTATSFTIHRMRLPPAWKVSEMKADPNLEPEISLLANGVKIFFSQLKDIHYNVVEQGNVPIADKSSYMNYLAIIGSALDEMQELIYLIESSNAKMSKMLNSVLLEAQINKTEKAKEEAAAQKEAQEASKGKAVVNVIGKILGPVLAILTVVAALAMSLVPPMASLAPLLIGIAVVMVALSVSKAAGFDILAEGFKAIDSMMSAILPEGPLCLAAEAMIKAVIVTAIIVTCCICGPGGVLLAMNLGVEALLASNVIANIVEACGGGEMAQMIATMVVMVLLMVALIGVMVASLPSVAATAATTATTAESAAATTAQGASVTSRVVAKARLVAEQLKNALKAYFTTNPEILAKRIQTLAIAGSAIANSTFKIAESAANINKFMILAELAMRIANLKADQEEKQAIIKTLRMAINSLLAELANLTDMTAAINKLRPKILSDTAMRHIQG